mmetsp:Transcript_14168/g.40109  ORF Transcript_14168/g.40109 Transcript_14168/m.40109 type:complete len:356 (+) Transcript_14168:180-1247(+)
MRPGVCITAPTNTRSHKAVLQAGWREDHARHWKRAQRSDQAVECERYRRASAAPIAIERSSKIMPDADVLRQASSSLTSSSSPLKPLSCRTASSELAKAAVVCSMNQSSKSLRSRVASSAGTRGSAWRTAAHSSSRSSSLPSIAGVAGTTLLGANAASARRNRMAASRRAVAPESPTRGAVSSALRASSAARTAAASDSAIASAAAQVVLCDKRKTARGERFWLAGARHGRCVGWARRKRGLDDQVPGRGRSVERCSCRARARRSSWEARKVSAAAAALRAALAPCAGSASAESPGAARWYVVGAEPMLLPRRGRPPPRRRFAPCWRQGQLVSSAFRGSSAALGRCGSDRARAWP